MISERHDGCKGDNELIIKIPDGANKTVYAVLGDEVLRGELKEIDIEIDVGLVLVIQLTTSKGETITVDFVEEDLGKMLFIPEEEARTALSKMK